MKLAQTSDCMKCPMFCTNWHDVRVCAYGCPDFWQEVSNVLHELARCSSLCIWLADHLARSVQYFARIGTMFEFVPLVGTIFGTKCPTFGTKLHEECTKKAVCFFVRVDIDDGSLLLYCSI